MESPCATGSNSLSEREICQWKSSITLHHSDRENRLALRHRATKGVFIGCVGSSYEEFLATMAPELTMLGSIPEAFMNTSAR